MKLSITSYPYAVQNGTIEVPDGLSEEELMFYVEEHWDEISFSQPELDYCGTDFQINN